jgi:hypothetical protein
MSAKEKENPVAKTIELMDQIFDTIVQIALLGRLNLIEDTKLSYIVDKLNELHEEFGDRELLNTMERHDTEEALALNQKIQDRLLKAFASPCDEDMRELLLEELNASNKTIH